MITMLNTHAVLADTISNYSVTGMSDEDLCEFRGIIGDIMLSPEAVSAITNIAETITPDMVGDSVIMMSEEVNNDLVKVLGDIPEVNIITTAVKTVMAVALTALVG